MGKYFSTFSRFLFGRFKFYESISWGCSEDIGDLDSGGIDSRTVDDDQGKLAAKTTCYRPCVGFPGGSVVKNPPAVWETWVRSLFREDFLEKGMATHSSILARRTPWSLEGYSPWGHQRAGHDLATRHQHHTVCGEYWRRAVLFRTITLSHCETQKYFLQQLLQTTKLRRLRCLQLAHCPSPGWLCGLFCAVVLPSSFFTRLSPEIPCRHSRDRSFYVSTWPGSGMPRKPVKRHFWMCPWEFLQELSIWVSTWNRSTSPAWVGIIRSIEGLYRTKQETEGEFSLSELGHPSPPALKHQCSGYQPSNLDWDSHHWIPWLSDFQVWTKIMPFLGLQLADCSSWDVLASIT